MSPAHPHSASTGADFGGDPPCWEGLVADQRDLQARAGLDLDTETQINYLVTDFYREVIFDPLLGPVFDEDAEVDWGFHIPHLIDYWCWILLGDRRYSGNVTRSHRDLHAISPITAEHCDRWFELWCSCIDARWRGPVADHAKRHAETLMAGLAKHVFAVAWEPASEAQASTEAGDPVR